MQRAKGSRKGPRTSLHQREGAINRWAVTAYVNAEVVHRQIYFEMEGELTEPFAATSTFSILAFEDQSVTASACSAGNVGSFLDIKPKLHGVVSLSREEFSLLMLLATSGNLKGCSFSFRAASRRKAEIVSFSFGSELPSVSDEASEV